MSSDSCFFWSFAEEMTSVNLFSISCKASSFALYLICQSVFICTHSICCLSFSSSSARSYKINTAHCKILIPHFHWLLLLEVLFPYLVGTHWKSCGSLFHETVIHFYVFMKTAHWSNMVVHYCCDIITHCPAMIWSYTDATSSLTKLLLQFMCRPFVYNRKQYFKTPMPSFSLLLRLIFLLYQRSQIPLKAGPQKCLNTGLRSS